MFEGDCEKVNVFFEYIKIDSCYSNIMKVIEMVIYKCDFGDWYLRMFFVVEGSCCYWLFLDINISWESWIFVFFNSFVFGKWWICLSDNVCRDVRVNVMMLEKVVKFFENFDI